MDGDMSSIVHLNVGGGRFSTSRQTLLSIPNTFFTSLLSGQLSVVRDETGAIFIDRDPELFRVVLNYMRSKQIDLSTVPLAALRHEAQYYGLAPLARRLALCQDLDESKCGDVLFHALIPPPPKLLRDLDAARKHDSSICGGSGSSSTGSRPSATIHSNPHHCRPAAAEEDGLRVRLVRCHHNTIAVAYARHVCVHRYTGVEGGAAAAVAVGLGGGVMPAVAAAAARARELPGWQLVYTSASFESPVRLVALNTKFGAAVQDRMLGVALENGLIELISVPENATANAAAHTTGSFRFSASVDRLFFIGSQLVALHFGGRRGRLAIWHAMSQSWQTQEIPEAISCYDTAGSSLLLGCRNGIIYYIDLQKFPLRMKDNDLLVSELYADPNGEPITAISVYLTPKTNLTGNWIEIAYGTDSGGVRIIVQHPETVGHGPQLFQTFAVHTSPVTRVALSLNHLISVCAEYNHVRTWGVARFRGMISTQPGSQALASFKVLTLDSGGGDTPASSTSSWLTPTSDSSSGAADPGPYGDQDAEKLFVQRVVADSNVVFVRVASTGDRLCTVRTVDGAPVTAFTVHECEGSTRIGSSRPRRFLFLGTATGTVQMFDLSAVLETWAAGLCVPNLMGAPVTHVAPPIGVQGAGGQSGAGASGQQLAIDKQGGTASQLFLRLGASSGSLASVAGSSSAAGGPSTSSGALGGPTPLELLALIDECELCGSSKEASPQESPTATISRKMTIMGPKKE